MKKLVINDKKILKRFIGLLRIPTYNQFSQVMIYDVIQQLCHKKNLLYFN